jgi:hypothetical protein
VDGDYTMDAVIAVVNGDALGIEEGENGVEGRETGGVCEAAPV